MKIGSARINEKGTINGGKSGDQTGREVAIEPWYNHKKGWVIIRAKTHIEREQIAKCMEMLCNNNNFGYCQNHRLTGYKEAKKYNFDCSKVNKKVEVDCSEAVRICCAYAGIMLPDFYTGNEKEVCKKSGKFEIITTPSYCNDSKNWKRGDIGVTRTKGHTIVCLSDGTSDKYYKRYTGQSDSIVVALNAVGVNSSKANRKKIAEKNGVKDYKFTAEQNTYLLKLLKQGKLKRV